MGLPQTVKSVLPWKAKIPEMLAIPAICLDLVHANLWLITAPAENPKKNSLLYLAFSSPILFNSSVLWSITLIRKSSSSSKEKQQFPPFHVWPQTPFYMKINVVKFKLECPMTQLVCTYGTLLNRDWGWKYYTFGCNTFASERINTYEFSCQIANFIQSNCSLNIMILISNLIKDTRDVCLL